MFENKKLQLTEIITLKYIGQRVPDKYIYLSDGFENIYIYICKYTVYYIAETGEAVITDNVVFNIRNLLGNVGKLTNIKLLSVFSLTSFKNCRHSLSPIIFSGI